MTNAATLVQLNSTTNPDLVGQLTLSETLI